MKCYRVKFVCDNKKANIWIRNFETLEDAKEFITDELKNEKAYKYLAHIEIMEHIMDERGLTLEKNIRYYYEW